MLFALSCSFLFATPPAGIVIGWGFNGNGEATGIPTSSPPFIFTHTNDMHMDGFNGFIEPSFTGSTGVVTIAGEPLTNAIAVAAGDCHGLALRNDGTVVGWGLNNNGEATGVPSSGHASGQVTIGGIVLSNVVAIAAGFHDSFALKKDGTVVRWGGVQVYPPNILHDGLSNITAIAAGYTSGLGIQKDGRMLRLNGASWMPLPDACLNNIVAVAAGNDIDEENLAIKKDGSVVYWHGAFGEKPVPYGLSNVVAVAAGVGNCLALKSDGTIVGWGKNRYGQVTGSASEKEPYTSSGLVTIKGTVLSNVVAIAAAGSYMYEIGYGMALKQNGTVVSWGNFSHNQVANVPDGLSNVVAIAAGGCGSSGNSGGFCLAINTNYPSLAHFQSH